MGIGLSLELASSISIAREWNWDKILRMVDTFLKEELDFNLDNRTVERITGLNSDETDALVVALTRRVDAQVNGITLLIACVLLTKDSVVSIDERMSTIYRLMDFDGSGEITMEEMGIILFCLAMASSFILQRHRLCPTALEVKQINETIFSEMGKQVTSCVTREEFMRWACDITPKGEDTTIFDVYKYFVVATGNEAMKKDADMAEATEIEHQDKIEKQREADAAKELAEKEAVAKKLKAEQEEARLKAEREEANRKEEEENAKRRADEDLAERSTATEEQNVNEPVQTIANESLDQTETETENKDETQPSVENHENKPGE